MFENKTIVVCGATQGIGEAVCDTVLSLGGNLIQVARDESVLATNAEAWGKHYPDQEVSSLPLDMSLDASAGSLSEFLDTRSPIDGLVVTIGNGKPSAGDVVSRLRTSLDQNLICSANAMMGTLNYFQPSTHSSVVLVSSIAGHELISCPPEYAASKAALEMLTKHWSHLHAPIRFNIVAPGNIETNQSVWARRMKDDPHALETELLNSVPLGRLGTPNEVANVIVFLLSPKSSFMTGSVVTVDGGQQRSVR